MARKGKQCIFYGVGFCQTCRKTVQTQPSIRAPVGVECPICLKWVDISHMTSYPLAGVEKGEALYMAQK